ncbi:hypothetical protein ABZ927_36810 [Streptomyces massasporeus]
MIAAVAVSRNAWPRLPYRAGDAGVKPSTTLPCVLVDEDGMMGS